MEAVGGQAPVAQGGQQVAALLLAGDDGHQRHGVDQGSYQVGEDARVVGEQLVDPEQDGGLPLEVGRHAPRLAVQIQSPPTAARA